MNMLLKKATPLISVLVFSCASNTRPAAVDAKQVDDATGNYWSEKYSTGSGLRYVITFPKSYDTEIHTQYPVIMFLHSMEEWGHRCTGVVAESCRGRKRHRTLRFTE